MVDISSLFIISHANLTRSTLIKLPNAQCTAWTYIILHIIFFNFLLLRLIITLKISKFNSSPSRAKHSVECNFFSGHFFHFPKGVFWFILKPSSGNRQNDFILMFVFMSSGDSPNIVAIKISYMENSLY